MSSQTFLTEDSCLQDALFGQLQEETKVFNSLPQILTKVRADGHLLSVYSLLNHIFSQEKGFALTRGLKRAEGHPQ